MRDPPNDWLTWLIVHMPQRVLERRGVTYGITRTNKRAPMAYQPEVLLRRFSFLQKGRDSLRQWYGLNISISRNGWWATCYDSAWDGIDGRRCDAAVGGGKLPIKRDNGGLLKQSSPSSCVA